MTRKTEKPELFARCMLPIIFVVDTSGAMSGQSISVLNTCLEETIQNIGENRKFCCNVIPKIGILQVHTGSSWVNPNELELAERLDYQPLDAAGLRDMGSALVELNEKLSRKAFLDFPIGKGAPIIIYVVCGQITDDWRSSLYGSLLKNKWYQRSIKLGFALGEDADIEALSEILGESGAIIQVYEYAAFSKAFTDIVVDTFNRCSIHYTYFDKAKNPRDIIQDVIDGFTQNADDVNVIMSHPSVIKVDSAVEDDDRVLKNMMAYSEIWTILNLLENSYASRVPQQVKNFFEEERLKDYIPQIDVDRPLTEQNLQRETMVLLALLNVNYWCDSEEEREFWLREMANNDNSEYDPNDMSWDLSHLFDESEKIYDNNDEYPTETEEENHVLIHMPNGELTIYVNYHDEKTMIPLKFFELHETIDTNTSTDPALEIFLWNSWGPVLDVKNIGLDDIYSRQRIAPESTAIAVDGSKLIHKIDGEAVFQINMIGTDTYIKNISKSAAEIIRPIHKGEKISVGLDSALVNSEGELILSISTPDGWILEEWDPDNEW